MLDQDAFLSSFSTALDITRASMFPASDTIRGGLTVVVSAEAEILLDTSQDQRLIGSTLPVGYTSSVVSGGSVGPTSRGVLTSLSHTPGGSALITSPTSFERFDAAIDFEVIASPNQPVGVMDIARFEFQLDASNLFRVSLQKGVGASPGQFLAHSEVLTVPGEGLVVGSAVPFDASSKLTLRLVRNENRAFAFVGRRDRTGLYTELTRMLNYKFFTSSGVGFVRFGSVDTAANGLPAQARWSNLTFRSHVTIDGELIEDKVDFAQRRLVGKVPPTSQDRRGLRDIFVFGLFGEAEALNGFNYVLPAPKTVGRKFTDELRTYTDTQLRDLQTSVDLKDIDDLEDL